MFCVNVESPFDFHPLLTWFRVGDVVVVVTDIGVSWFFGGLEKKEFEAVGLE